MHSRGVFLSGRENTVKKPSKTVQKRFTNPAALCGILSMSMREAAIPSRQTANRSFISLLPPFFLFCEMTAGRSGSIPLWTGALCRIRTGAGFVKNLSKYVQESFTIKGAGYDILSLSEGKNTFPPANSFYTLFSFFHLFFLPSFSFLHGMRPVSRVGNRAFPCLCGARCNCNKSFTGYSKSVHTFRPAVGYTEYVSKGSRNPEAGKPTDLLFLFYPPFFKSV